MRILIVSAIVLLLDQITKLSIKASFRLFESVSVFGDFFRLTYIENPGMAFGIKFAGPWFFITFSIVASIAISVYLYKLRDAAFLPRFTFALILGGALGNLIDRIAYGRVIDFLDFGLSGSRFPVFNVADIAVSVGMTLLIFMIIFEKDEKQKDDSVLEMKRGNPADLSLIHI